MNQAATDGTTDRETLQRVVRSTLTGLSRTGALPALPGVATAGLAIARDPDSEVDELTRVIQTDIGLAARILRVANSPGYGRRRQAQNVQDAVMTLGLRQTCDILVTACAKQLYTAPGPYTELLWNHSLAVAVGAEEIARLTRRVSPSITFLSGLFHDIGRIAFQMADPASFGVVQGLVESGEGQSNVLECEWYEFDHAQAGTILTEDWGLSPEQCDAIRWHHDPEQAGEGRNLATVLNAADSVAYAIGYGTYPEPPSSIGMASLGFSADEETACVARVRDAFEVQKQLIS